MTGKFSCERPQDDLSGNRRRSIYQYSNMGPRLSGQTSIFGVAFFVSKSLFGIEGQKKLEYRERQREESYIVQM